MLTETSEPDKFACQLAEMRARTKAERRIRIRRLVLLSFWSIGLIAMGFEAGKWWSGTLTGTIRPTVRIGAEPANWRAMVFAGPRGGRFHYNEHGLKVYERRP